MQEQGAGKRETLGTRSWFNHFIGYLLLISFPVLLRPQSIISYPARACRIIDH